MGRTGKYKEHLLKSLQDPQEAAAYLDACLEDDDPHVFLLALKDVAEARGGMGQLSKRSSLNRQSLYRSLSRTGNPKLINICTILTSLGFEFHITPVEEGNIEMDNPTFRKGLKKIRKERHQLARNLSQRGQPLL